MASEEQNNRQREFNEFLERELELREEARAFLGETLSIGAQLQDQIEHQVKRFQQKLTLDKEILRSSKENINVVRRLSNEYSSITEVQKDQLKIEKQLQSSRNVIAAKTQELSKIHGKNLKSVMDEAKAYVDREKAIETNQIATQALLDKQEEMEKEFSIQEGQGKSLTEQQVQRRLDLQKSIDKQQEATSQLTQQQEAAKGLVDAEAVSIVLLEEQNKQLEKANKHLAEEEVRLKQLQQNQTYWNLSLGAAEGFLKKIGLEGVASSLGLEEGAKAAEAMAKQLSNGGRNALGVKDQLKVLGAGIKGTFKGMNDALTPAAIATGAGILLGKALGGVANTIKKMVILPLKGAFNALVSPAKKVFSEITGFASSFVDYISSSFFSIQGLVDTFNKGDQLNQQLSQATEDIATGLGVSTQEAENLTDQVRQFSGELGAFPEVLAQNMVALNQAFGTTQKFSDETARSFNRMVERLGFSTEEAAEFVKIAKITGETENDILGGIEDQTMALKNQYGVAISQKSVFQDISKASSATRLSLGNNTKELTNAAFQAKRLGLEMDQVASMGSNLLEFESSIANEMEAELLIGRDLNLERARAAFLNNDIATAAQEIAGQIGSAADFSKMNVIQQEALAKAVGTNREGLADMLETQEMLANTGFKDMSEAQQEFNKLVESGMNIEQAQAEFRERYGNEALATQAAQVSYAKQREMQERALIASASKIAEALMPVARALRNFQERIEEIRVVMIDQMRPFFKELGSFVGDAGDQFAIILESYIKPLGKRLNDIGLTLIGFARKNGPEFKKTFESILDVFGSIYGLVGDIIKELFNVKGTSSVADPLKNSLQLVQNIAKDIVSYVKSIDAGGIAEKIQKVITGIGNFYQGLYKFVKGTITTIRDAINYVKENPIKSILGTGAAIGLAKLLKRGSSRLFPMFTKDVSIGKQKGDLSFGRDTFNTIKGLFKGPKSGEGLTGTNRIVNAIRGGYKGGGFKGALQGAQTAAGRMGASGGRAASLVRGAGRIGSGASQLAGRVGLSSLLGSSAASAAGAGAAGAGATGAGAGAAGAAGAGGLTAASLGPAIIGLAASYGLNILKKDQQAKVSSIDVDLTKDISANQVKVLEEQRETSKNNSKMLGIAAETAKYAGIGATIGSIIPGIGTALGAGVGAIVGGAIGTYNEYGDDISDWGSALGLWSERASKAADDFNESFRKTQQKLARTQAKIAKNLQKAEATRNLAIKRATRDVVDQFKDLASAGKINFETVKSTDKGFQDFARQMYLAGNLTEEEFQNAINGVVTPMNTLKSATEGASSRLDQAFSKIEGKIQEEAKSKTETARFEFFAREGFDPVLFQESTEKILAASTADKQYTANLLKTQLDQFRRSGADVNPLELLDVFTGKVTDDAGIVASEAKRLYETIAGDALKAAKGDQKALDAIKQSFILALKSMDTSADLEEEASSLELVETFNKTLSNKFDELTSSFTQTTADIQAKTQAEIANEFGKVEQITNATSTINQNFATNQDQITKSLKTDNETTSGLIEDQLKKDDELYELLDRKLTKQGTSLQEILAKGIDPSELIELQKGLIELSKAALETGNADISEKVITLSSNLGVQDGVIRSIQQVQDGSSISHNGPFTIQDSKGNVAITHPKDKLVVSPNVSYIADGATGKGGPVFPVSEKFGALDVKVGKEGVLVQKINDGITGNPTQYINDGISQDELFESYGITTEAKTKKYTYKPPKTSSSRSGKGKGSSKPSGSSTTGMTLQEILEKRALTKEEEEFRNQGLLAGTLFEPDMQLLRENKRDIYELKINPADYFDPITGTSILDKTQYEFGVNAKYGLGHTYTPNATPTYNSYLTPGYKYGIFDFEDLTTVLSKPVNVNAQGGAIGMSLGMASPTFINLQEMSAGGGIDLTQDYNTHPEMQVIMQKVLPSQASPSSAINYTAQSDATNINVPNLQFTPYYDAVTPTVQYIQDGETGTTRSGVSYVLPSSDYLKRSKEKGFAQKVVYSELSGATSSTKVVSPSVLSDLGVSGISSSNYKGLFRSDSLPFKQATNIKSFYNNIELALDSQSLKMFTPAGKAPATDSFSINYAGGETDSIYNSGDISFPKASALYSDIESVEASGNGLLALGRAIAGSSDKQVPSKVKIGFQQERKSTSTKFDTDRINNLVPTFNGITNAIMYHSVPKEDKSTIPYFTNKNTVEKLGTSNFIKESLENRQIEVLPNYLKHQGFKDVNSGSALEDVYSQIYGMAPLDLSFVDNIVSTLPVMSPSKMWKSPIIQLENGVKEIGKNYIPQYKENVLDFLAKHLTNDPEQLGKFVQYIEPKWMPPYLDLAYGSLLQDKEYTRGTIGSTSLTKKTGEYEEGASGLQQVNDGIGFWEVISNPMGAVKHYVLPTLMEESGHIIKSLFKTKALSTALKGILKKTPVLGWAMHAGTGALNIKHLLHEEGMSEDQLNQEVGTAALVALGGIGGGIIGGMLAGTLSSITGPGAIVIGTLGGIVGSMIGEMFAEFAADTLGAEPVGRPIVSMFKEEEASLPSYRPHLTENIAPKLESQFEPPQNVLDGYSYWDVITDPTEYLRNTLSEAGEIGLTKLVNGAFAAPAIRKGAINLSKATTKRLPFIGPVIEALVGGYDAYNAVEEYKNDPQSPPISELYQELGTIGYETLGGIGGSLIGGLALTPALGPVGTFIGGLLGGLGGQLVGSLLADIFGAESMGRKMTNFFTSVPQQVQDGSALSSRGPFTITDKFGATAITAKGDGVVVSPNISYVNDGIVDAEPINQIATSSTQQHTTVIEQDNSELKQELESMKQLMSELIKELPTIANRPITIELDGNKVGEGLGRIGYRG